MSRSVETLIRMVRLRGAGWPVRLACRRAACILAGIPGGLVAEPTRACTGSCGGCTPASDPAVLDEAALAAWLDCAPVRPATVHFAGKHSDPLASPVLPSLVRASGSRAVMVSVSTIGLGMTPALAAMPVDRWIVSLPAATGETWTAVRGTGRFAEAVGAAAMVRDAGKALLEVVMTLWRPSENDRRAFEDLSRREGWEMTGIVFGRYDPTGHHVGRKEMLALGAPGCPYALDGDGGVVLSGRPGPCPFLGYLFLDASGTLRPCPFCEDADPFLTLPSAGSWKAARAWRRLKSARTLSGCGHCP